MSAEWACPEELGGPVGGLLLGLLFSVDGEHQTCAVREQHNLAGAGEARAEGQRLELCCAAGLQRPTIT